MICYFDTSALVKLYVEEEGSDLVSDYTRKSLFVATSKVAYAEARAAFARAWRSGVLGEKEYREVVLNFREDWPRYFILEVSEPVLQRVDSLVEKYSLRGFDALHLASTIVIAGRIKGEEGFSAMAASARYSSRYLFPAAKGASLKGERQLKPAGLHQFCIGKNFCSRPV